MRLLIANYCYPKRSILKKKKKHDLEPFNLTQRNGVKIFPFTLNTSYCWVNKNIVTPARGPQYWDGERHGPDGAVPVHTSRDRARGTVAARATGGGVTAPRSGRYATRARWRGTRDTRHLQTRRSPSPSVAATCSRLAVREDPRRSCTGARHFSREFQRTFMASFGRRTHAAVAVSAVRHVCRPTLPPATRVLVARKTAPRPASRRHRRSRPSGCHALPARYKPRDVDATRSGCHASCRWPTVRRGRERR